MGTFSRHGRVGVFGGSFDPVHFGHLSIAEEARVVLTLDLLLIVPAGQQPEKIGYHAATPQQRLAMTRLACADNPHFAVSPIEIERPGLSYTADTLAAIRADYDADLYFILGADVLNGFPAWERADEVLRLSRIAALSRPGVSVDLAALDAAMPGLAAQTQLIDGPQLEISSTDLRRRLARRLPVRYQLPDAVIDYIQEQRLYAER